MKAVPEYIPNCLIIIMHHLVVDMNYLCTHSTLSCSPNSHQLEIFWKQILVCQTLLKIALHTDSRNNISKSRLKNTRKLAHVGAT